MTLDARSFTRLIGVHHDLQRVVNRCHADGAQFIVTEGVRTLERQKLLVASCASKTLKSRHLTGHAVDLAALVGGEVRWDWPLYAILAQAMKEAARAEYIAIEWGGDWRTFRDGPHFQLPWDRYPEETNATPEVHA